MPSRTYPNLALVGGWSSGEDGYGDAMNANLFRLSCLVHLTAISIVTVLPTEAADGEIYLMDATADTNPGMVIVRDDSLWKTIAPAVGWECFVINTAAKYRYMGGGWQAVATAATIPAFSETNANYQLAVNGAGTGVMWVPPYENPYEIPQITESKLDYVMTIIENPAYVDPATTPGEDVVTLGWRANPLSLPAPAGLSDAGKVAALDALGTGVIYKEDGEYRPVAPGYVLTDADFSGRVILGATGNIQIPANIARNSTLTIVRMSTNEVEISAASGVSLSVAESRYKIRQRFSAVSIVKTGTDEFIMFGDVSE